MKQALRNTLNDINQTKPSGSFASRPQDQQQPATTQATVQQPLSELKFADASLTSAEKKLEEEENGKLEALLKGFGGDGDEEEFDFEDFEEKKRKEVEEEKKKAEERRKRLEEIKAKHQQQQQEQLLPSNGNIQSSQKHEVSHLNNESSSDSSLPSKNADVAPPSSSSSSSKPASSSSSSKPASSSSSMFHDDSSDEDAPPVNSRMRSHSLSISKTTETEPSSTVHPIEASSSSNHATTTTVVEDEGNQLARERLALENEKEALGKVIEVDMFSDSPSDLEKIYHGRLPTSASSALASSSKQLIEASSKGGKRATREQLLAGEGISNPHLSSNWDDGEGYYKATIGELIGNRFQILGIMGKGVFATVLKCIDTRYVSEDDDEEAISATTGVIGGTIEAEEKRKKALLFSKKIVAIKMIRNNEVMRKAAEKEKMILLQLAEKDPMNRRCIIKLITHLEYRHHIALVFEYQQMNLREALKKFGKDVGINILALKIYAKQLFIALRYLQELKIIHADIKLDNILVSEDLKQVKICDFGSAFYENDYNIPHDCTPYLVARFYRAPEIILGK
jgi:serine/threonine-protein kinase PRP4